MRRAARLTQRPKTLLTRGLLLAGLIAAGLVGPTPGRCGDARMPSEACGVRWRLVESARPPARRRPGTPVIAQTGTHQWSVQLWWPAVASEGRDIGLLVAACCELKPDAAAALVDAPPLRQRGDEQQASTADIADASFSHVADEAAAFVDDLPVDPAVVNADPKPDLADADLSFSLPVRGCAEYLCADAEQDQDRW